MDNNQKDLFAIWEEIFNNVKTDNLSLELFDSMTIEVVTKYYCVIQMQFYAFDLIDEGKNDLSSDFGYFRDNVYEHFQGNENDYLNISRTVKHLYKYRQNILKIINEHSITNDEFIELFNKTLNEYKVVYQIV